jgi:hypothetical protein
MQDERFPSANVASKRRGRSSASIENTVLARHPKIAGEGAGAGNVPGESAISGDVLT